MEDKNKTVAKEAVKPEKEKKPKEKGQGFRQLSLLLGIIFIAFTSGMLGAGLILQTNDAPNITSNPAVDGNELSTGSEKSVSKIVESVGPSVVSIVVESQANTIFGTVMQSGAGTGVIISSDGYILTNNHVIAQAEHIVVALHDGRRAEAKVIGTDPDTDLAVIKIELDKLPVLPFKLSGNEVGDVVLAIGNPFGVGQTVTQGIISATGRSDLGINTYEDFIQTDAAINPGNSGGALIDVAGNLIGVNTAIFSQSGGSLGIGFAIPAQICQQVLNSILKDGRVVRGWLGISLIPNTLDEDVLASKPVGVIVADVLRDGPADAAGVKRGDKIIQVNNEQISSASHLINYVALQAPASVIDVVVERDGKQQTLQVKVGERKVQQNAQSQYIPLPKQQ